MGLKEKKLKIIEFLQKCKKAFGAVPRAMVNAFDAITASLRRKPAPSRPDAPAGAAAEEMSKESGGSGAFNIFSKKIKALSGKFLDRLPEEKRKPVLFGLGGLLILFFILLISFLAMDPAKSDKPVSRAISAGSAIPQEDLFLPAEPDYLPDFIFERDPRRGWSMEDIRPYWKSPEKTGQWKEEIKSAVDKLMEGVP